jgi:hypothetical protein
MKGRILFCVLACLAVPFAASVHGQATGDTDILAITTDKSVFVKKLGLTFSVAPQEDGFRLNVQGSQPVHQLDESAKPRFLIGFSPGNKYMVVYKPMGFTTMASIFEINADPSKIRLVYSSAESNTRPSVDYRLKRWDMDKGVAEFDVLENPQYLKEQRPARLLAREYIYLDGKTLYH